MDTPSSRLPGAPARDTLGPILHPLVFPVVVLVLGLLLQRVLPLPQPSRGVAIGAGAVTLVPGLLVMAGGARAFRRSRTSPNPTRPTTTLVTDGIYRFTRNPMYLGISLVYLGLALLSRATWAILLTVLVVGLLEVAVIRREEHFLDRLFGDAYRDYRSRVRRWL